MSFWCLIFSKKPTKNLTNFCPESKKLSNHKIKAHYIDLDTNYVQIISNIMRRCLYFVVLTTFYILGQKFVKYFVVFFGKSKTSKGHSEINWPLASRFWILKGHKKPLKTGKNQPLYVCEIWNSWILVWLIFDCFQHELWQYLFSLFQWINKVV